MWFQTMILEFPTLRVRRASEVDAAPEPKRLPLGNALRITLLLSLALWGVIGWAVVRLVF
jgi:hypothetical protein